MSSNTMYTTEDGTVAKMIQDMRQRERRFRCVCAQLVLMNNNIQSAKCRYDRAVTAQQRSFRYTYRLRLTALEGVRAMFTTFAHNEANKLEALEQQLLEDYDVDWREMEPGVEML